ncbi:cytochrome P450 [Streptomyces sp. NPDC048665]|uniref:cytochrome P450 n=1 Tax=Streptomyces sp. NPDC048665 TaxID=3155490 RepID=UPI00343609C5
MRISTERLGSEIRAGAVSLTTRSVVRALALCGDPVMRVLGRRAPADPYPDYERIRARGAMVGHPLGMHITTDHAISRVALRDPRLGVKPAPERPGGIPWQVVSGEEARYVHPLDESMLVLNPPEHTRLRRLASPLFTPRAMQELTRDVEKVVDRVLDRVEGRERFDLVADFARRIPIEVICDLFALPDADRTAFVRWGQVLANTLDGIRTLGERREVRRALAEMTRFLSALVEERRRDPGEDMVSRLVAGEVDGEPLDGRTLVALVGILLLAGFETTVNAISGAAVALLRHPGQKHLLLDDPALAGEAVEEFLRYDAPVQMLGRIALEPVTLGGVSLPAGAMLVIVVAAANRDPAVFEEPHRFDLHRPNKRDHLAFSAGIHYCLGAGLARLETELALRNLFARLPRLAPAGELRMRPIRNVRGAAAVPVLSRGER